MFSCGGSETEEEELQQDQGDEEISLTLEISDLLVEFPENPANEAEIGKITFSSENLTEDVTFEITELSVNGAVSINSDGALIVSDASAFDYESVQSITGKVSASADDLTDEASFTITITNVLEVVSVSTFAGNGNGGFINGPAANAEFNNSIDGIVADNDGNIFVADLFNYVVRKITPDGVVSTYSGSGTRGSSNGASNVAEFSYIISIEIDQQGNLYVGDGGSNHVIRKITPDGTVSTFAGVMGTEGYKDSDDRLTAEFDFPTSLTFDQNGDLYVCDNDFNNRIRKVSTEGIVSTIAGGDVKDFKDGNVSEAQFNNPRGIAIDDNGNLYVCDIGNNRIRKISPDGEVSTVAGSGDAGYKDCQGTSAQFNLPLDIEINSEGDFYILDSRNNAVRKMTPDGVVTTIAGDGTSGYKDGDPKTANFNGPRQMTIDQLGNLYITDRGNVRIRKITIE